MSSRGESASGCGALGSGWPALARILAPGFTSGLAPGLTAPFVAAAASFGSMALPFPLGSAFVFTAGLASTFTGLAGVLTDLSSTLALGAGLAGADFRAGAALALAALAAVFSAWALGAGFLADFDWGFAVFLGFAFVATLTI